jgi:hypothetical protein
MKSRGTHGLLQRAVLVAVCAATGLATLGCGTSGNEGGAGPSDAPVTSTAANVVEETATIGQSIEVADLTSTVTELHRQKSFGTNADLGYVVAQVTVENKSTATHEYHRLQFHLQLPDGSSTNRTPIAGQAQLGQGELAPGEQATGQLIFTVEQAGGDFALVFEPRQDDRAERERGVWRFTSQPGEAR